MGIANNCLNCKHPLNAAACAADLQTGKPETGDLTVCVYCSHLMACDDRLNLRELRDEEIVEAAGNKDILRTMKFAAGFRKAKEDRDQEGNDEDDEDEDRADHALG